MGDVTVSGSACIKGGSAASAGCILPLCYIFAHYTTLAVAMLCTPCVHNMYIYIPIFMCMTALAVECCALKRAKGLTDGILEPVTIIGTMGKSVRLPGYLESTTQPFYKDNQVLHAIEHIYELTKTPSGYQVNIRFLTCTDEGTYRVGRDTFDLRAKADSCGMFYYTAKVDRIKKAAFISPLDGVITIAMLYIQPENSQMWSLIEVWNDTMSRTISPAHCCFMIHNGTTFGGYGDKQYKYFMYERRGQAHTTCEHVKLTVATTATTTGKPMMYMPDLKELEDVKTPLKLLNVSKSELPFCYYFSSIMPLSIHKPHSAHSVCLLAGIQDLKRMLDAFDRPWNSAGSHLHIHSSLTHFMIMITTLMAIS